MSEICTTLSQRGVISVGGDDRKKFLQGMVSNDVMRVNANCGIYAAMLNPQGKFLHDLFIIEVGDALWLDCEAARIDDLMKRLNQFKLRSAVTVTDVSSSHGVAVTFFGQSGAMQPCMKKSGALFSDPRLAALGWRSIAPRAQLPPEDAAAVRAYNHLRLSLGVPDGTQDMIPGESILLEYNLDRLNGVSFDKGCYIGQELTARTHYRALIKKRAYPVRIDGPCPAPGTAVMAGDTEVGVMRSSQDDVGLAVLRIESVKSELPISCGAARLQPVLPEWMERRLDS